MVVPFNVQSKEEVPSKTIRQSWDAYRDKNYGGTPMGMSYGPKPFGITALDGKPYSGDTYKYTGQKCTRRNLRGQCKNWVYPGQLSSARVPIGGWAEVYDGACNTGFKKDNLVYNQGQKLSDQLATNCAGGSSLTWGKYPTYDGDKSCSIDKPSVYRENEENCIQGGIHYPTFCQLGDYVVTQGKCREQCANVKSTAGNSYCNWSYDRLCGKKRNDPLKKNALNTLLVSDKDYIREQDCQKYCGPPSAKSDEMSPLCKRHKIEYCLHPDSWPDAGEYCKTFWKNNPNILEMNQACKEKLLNPASPENITTNLGCGMLCQGNELDIDPTYCRSMRQQYCTASDENMESKYCFNFCKDNPDLCENYLHQYCKDKGEKLDEALPNESGKRYSDYCGCMMGTQFYDDYKKGIFQQFKEGGYNIEGISNIRSEPECIYPQCKSGSILTSDQLRNIKNCGTSCVQVMMNNFEDAQVGGDFFLDQSAKCVNIQKIPEPTTSSAPPPSTAPSTTMAPSTSAPSTSAPSTTMAPISDSDDASAIQEEDVFIEDNETSIEGGGNNQAAIIGGSVVGFIILIIAIVLGVVYGKAN